MGPCRVSISTNSKQTEGFRGFTLTPITSELHKGLTLHPTSLHATLADILKNNDGQSAQEQEDAVPHQSGHEEVGCFNTSLVCIPLNTSNNIISRICLCIAGPLGDVRNVRDHTIGPWHHGDSPSVETTLQ